MVEILPVYTSLNINLWSAISEARVGSYSNFFWFQCMIYFCWLYYETRKKKCCFGSITQVRFKIQSYIEGRSESALFPYWKFKNEIKNYLGYEHISNQT